jgi:DNA-binding PadR family transcriptional regulator
MNLQKIPPKIFLIRKQNVMLDFQLALLYEVETRVLNQAVKRNRSRFPEDFMFQLTPTEMQNLISQNVISSEQHGGRRKLTYAFTEQGVAMLSSVLRSEKAIAVNIGIMRTFVALRQHAHNYDALAAALSELENSTNRRFTEVGTVLDALLEQKRQQEDFQKRKRIGFKNKH